MSNFNAQRISNLRKDAAYQRLADTIARLARGRKFLYSPATGNWGDGLINFGTRQFLEWAGLEYTEVHKNDTRKALADGVFKNAVVLMGGGGAWSRNFSRARNVTAEIADVARHVVVLPTTYDLPAVDARNVTYFARDYVTSLEVIPAAMFCHDMAFFADLAVPEPDERLWRLFAMRGDREGFGHDQLFPLNFDVSMLGDGDYKFVSPMFNILNNFKIITTDRMHLAVAGAMLGRKVNLVVGNYSKSSDVFQSSLRGSFPNVQLRDIEDVLRWFRGE